MNPAARWPLFQSRHLLMPEARDDVVVDHADSLHVGIDDRAAYEFEAALLEVLAERVRLLRRGRQVLHVREAVLNWFAADETPDVFVERAELFLHVEKSLGIRNCRGNLQPIAND